MDLFQDRLELKFFIPDHMVDDISKFASTYCSLDPHSHNAHEMYYRIRTLYLDTPDFLFLRKRVAQSEDRFNMRIRIYQDTSNVPCFFEIKRKKNRHVRKIRAKIDDVHWIKRMNNNTEKSNYLRKAAANETLFYKLKHIYNAEPKVLTEYMRKAYVSKVDHYARVTFDRKMKCIPTTSYSLITHETLCAYDHCSIFDAESSVILELKCFADKVPLWMLDLIKRFDLQRKRFSKYVSSIGEAVSWYNTAPISDRRILYAQRKRMVEND